MPQAFTIIPCQYSSHSSSSDRLVKFVTSYLWLHEDCVCWCIRPHTASHHPTSLTCASRSPPCQHGDRCAQLPAATSWCQGHESSSATAHSWWPAQKRGTACQSTSGHPKLSLHSRVARSHISLNFHTARSDDSSDIVRRPCSN